MLLLIILFIGVASQPINPLTLQESSAHLCLKHEREALLAFKTDFTIRNISGWSPCVSEYAKSDSWKVYETNNNDCCRWEGVTCDPSTGRVIDLDLSCSLLNGSFPVNSTLFRLRHLRYLNLAFNDFLRSPIPSSFGRLSDLTYLNLSSSEFSGKLPRELGWLSRLSTLDLSDNALNMPDFTTIIANLTGIKHLDLSDVSIASNIPLLIANLSKLESLRLRNCELHGEFPEMSIVGMRKLRVLDLGGNRNIHRRFSALKWRSPLELVDFSSCNFTGKLPVFIGNSSNSLRSFNIGNCRFHGKIPKWMWNVTEEIIVRYNNLSGSLPTTMQAEMSTIDFSRNKITGTIPGWVFTLASLNYLNLEHNLFTRLTQSPIANNSGNSSSLMYFLASENDLQGRVPEAVFRLRNLRSLELDNNNFSGTIPLSKIHNLQNLNILYLSHNNLSVIDDMGSNSTSFWPTFLMLGLSYCNLSHFPNFLKNQKNITILDLSNNGIHGMVPKWFLNVSKTSLSILDLSLNSLTGGLENLQWTNIQLFDISSNMLEGALPIPSPTTLQFIASKNSFTRAIPSSLCDMGSLALLDLSHNNLTGYIPDCFNSQWLETLVLKENQLQGLIPSLIFKDCLALTTLSLSGNFLHGPIPQSLSNCFSLQLLDLGNNKLVDSFPHWLDVLPNLQVLVLSSNNLKGTITTSNLTNSFSKLRILDMSENNLTGGLPRGLLRSFKAMMEENVVETLTMTGYMGNEPSIIAWVKGFYLELQEILDGLVLIDASRNRLQGHIPEEIGDLINIRWLNLAHNNFTGNIPMSLGNLSLLESLDLSFNKLDGQIPKELVNLNFLEFFNVSENSLVGPVPTTKQFGTFLDNSYIGNPELCGELLTKKCWKKDEPLNSTTIEGIDFESSNFHQWEIVLMGLGSGLFVGLVWGYFIFWERNYYWVVKLIFVIEILQCGPRH